MAQSVKLTKYIRDAVKKKIIDHRFGDERKEIEAREGRIALDIYNDIYSEAERKQMEALPAGWLPERDDVYVVFKFMKREYERIDFPEGVDKPCPYMNHSNVMKIYDDQDHPIYQAWEKYVDEKKALEAAIADAETQIDSITWSVTTVSSLKETWPEISNFLESYESTPDKVPMIVPQVLNSLLNLPPVEEKEAA